MRRNATSPTITEDEMIDGIRRVIRRNHIHVPDPDYRTTRMYPPQWKAFGACNYYQLPKSRGGKIIAKFYPHSGGLGPFYFDRKGVVVPGAPA